MTRLLKTVAETRDALASNDVALVPTMGALHEGHLALIRLAKQEAATVVVSIFVNPLQFGPDEDFDRYPRDLEADVALLEQEGVDFCFAPSLAEMYPDLDTTTRVSAGEVGRILEGEFRPTHFDGVLTVVAKLFNIIRPQKAIFGEKDAQQLVLVTKMARDLNYPVEIVAHPIVRETDGLARSSRNAYLSAEEREIALTLSKALQAIEDHAHDGSLLALAKGHEVYASEPLATMDYLELVDAATFTPIRDAFVGQALALTAARVGQTRLIDNRRVTFR